MKPLLSQDSTKSTTQKLFRSQIVIATKRIAYREIMHPENQVSQRMACKLIRVPRSTFQRWAERPTPINYPSLMEQEFFGSPEGVICIHRIILAATQTIRYGSTGIRGIQEFLELSKLNLWVASSTGALHAWVGKIEESIVRFGNEQPSKLSEGMIKKRISICQDENFHEGMPCLVAIEPVSNFILVEKMVEDRTKEEWTKAVNEGVCGLNVEIIQSTSDEGTSILAHVKQDLKAEHSPDLFHIQQELSRATSFPLKSQEKEFEKAVEAAEKKLKKAVVRHGADSVQAQEAKGICNLRRVGLADRTKRRQDVREAKRALGESYHPVNIETGQLRSIEQIKTQLNIHINVINEKCQEAELSDSSLRRVRKARGMIDTMISYLHFFFIMLKGAMESLNMNEEESLFFREVLIPLAYLEEIVRKQPTQKRKKTIEVLEDLERKARAGPWMGEKLKQRMIEAKEMARLFQRSSSCVEGRNGVLGLKHHGFQKISKRTLGALTVLHNYHVKRDDETTAAERFFGRKPDHLFEYMLETVPMLGLPRTRRRRERDHKVAA
jgi:hypothetical protein